MDLYNRKYLAYELIRETTDRDFSALSKAGANIRALRVKCIFDFERALKVMNWDEKKQNLYVGCAKLKSIPNFTFNPKDRSKETSVWYREQFNNFIQYYDLFFDFDKARLCPFCGLTDSQPNGLKKKQDDFYCRKCEKDIKSDDARLSTIEEVLEDVKVLKEYLDENKVPYYLLFSGNKGFQIVIDGKYLEIERFEHGNVFPHKSIQEKIKSMLDLKFLDMANTGVNSRLRKAPYSLVPNGETDEQEMNMAFPLTDMQFETFRIENMKVKNILASTKLVRRGTLERFQELSLEEKRENLQTFISLFAFK